ncbi:hypothetical protein SNE26_09235 [Mucilaginibacter sp. cycad4]|uniref:hypothetical protein n=1 Tax=Mucilaginibacter sp. cycad4 TaxID=3342096 RepID=UPI002AAAA5DA|nr:hypothetical protein [Mucilaginibacter gossypii]WPV01956.1 hypothetical protein SNE26_09235 [Mucilaginibacter gossypii]
MSLLQQYRKSDKLSIVIKSIVNNIVLAKIINEYKELLQQKDKEGFTFLEELKELEIRFIANSSFDETNEAFDLLFLSYLALLKADFPNITIKIYYPYFDEKERNNYFFKLNQHRLHFIITAKQEVFRLYKNNIEYRVRKISQSISYIPPLPINLQTIDDLFSKKNKNNDYLSILNATLNGSAHDLFTATDREVVFSKMQHLYKEKRGPLQYWTANELSGLYFLKALYDLYVLRWYIDLHHGVVSDYQIGSSIVNSKEDTESTVVFRKAVINVLNETGAFYFSDVEAYFFSLIISNSELFKIPTGRDDMLAKVSLFFQEHEVEQLAADNKHLKVTYINIYQENLERIIGYVKDIAYGLEELAKNVVEHTKARHDVITARIYKYQSIVSLKSIDKDWLQKFDSSHRFLDINVIDSGTISVKKSYKQSLLNERDLFTVSVTDDMLNESLANEYNDDIEKIEHFGLSDFFNYNSIKLYHQINRTKARLGLLIFSQTILHEKEAFVGFSSNDLEENVPKGCYMFVGETGIVKRNTEKMMPLGTHYNFIIPMKEVLQTRRLEDDMIYKETSISSSVFLELHNYGVNENANRNLSRVNFDSTKVSSDKYAKLDELKLQMARYPRDSIMVINADDLNEILNNSSDWIRFLANIQFSSDFFRDVIIYGLNPIVYVEIINILKLFDSIPDQVVGFWKKGRFILCYLPIDYNEGVFWFNHLLTGANYQQFVKLNDEVSLYHLNFNSVVDCKRFPVADMRDLDTTESYFFSKSKKLLNFELLIKGNAKISLFEETTRSLINVPIDNKIHEI